MKRGLGFLVVALAIPACTAQNESVSEGESDLATEASYVACSKAVATSDGQSLVYATCPGAYTGGAIVLRGLNGASRSLKSLGSNDTYLGSGATDMTVWWAYQTAGLTPQIKLQDISGVLPAAEANLPIVPQKIVQVRYLKDGTLAILALGKDWKQYLFTGRANTTPLVAQVLSENEYNSFDLWASSGGYDLYVVERINAGGVGAWRRIDHQGTGAPSVGAPIRAEKGVVGVAKGELLGSVFYAEVNTAPGVWGVGLVTMSTGKVQVMADGFKSFSSFVTSRQFAWFAGQRPTGTWELIRLSTRADLPGAQTLLTETGVLWSYLSPDATTLLFRGGPQGGSNSLGVVAADGTSAPTYVIDASEGKTIEVLDPQPKAGRYLISLSAPHTPETLRLVDATTARTLGEWKPKLDYDWSWKTLVSANGQAVYATRQCNATADSHGNQWMQLWPAYAPISGCEQEGDSSSSRTLEAIPNSSAVMLSGSTDGPGVIRVFRP